LGQLFRDEVVLCIGFLSRDPELKIRRTTQQHAICTTILSLYEELIECEIKRCVLTFSVTEEEQAIIGDGKYCMEMKDRSKKQCSRKNTRNCTEA
jgi:hypothetical protein